MVFLCKFSFFLQLLKRFRQCISIRIRMPYGNYFFEIVKFSLKLLHDIYFAILFCDRGYGKALCFPILFLIFALMLSYKVTESFHRVIRSLPSHPQDNGIVRFQATFLLDYYFIVVSSLADTAGAIFWCPLIEVSAFWKEGKNYIEKGLLRYTSFSIQT